MTKPTAGWGDPRLNFQPSNAPPAVIEAKVEGSGVGDWSVTSKSYS